MNKEKLIQIWKDNGIDKAEFKFSCGGDSMNDYSLLFYDEKHKELTVPDEFKEKFIDLIFNNVAFYEVSDGHYLGEYGTVHIYYDEELEDFDFTKSSVSEFSEKIERHLSTELTEEESNYYSSYIKDINLSDSGNYESIHYKKDFIKTDKHKEIEKDIINKVVEEAERLETSIRENDNYEEYFDVTDFTIDGNILEFLVSYSVIRTENEL